MLIRSFAKPAARLFVSACLVMGAVQASAAPALNRKISDVLSGVQGFKRTCGEVNDQFRPVRCPENVDLITARLAAKDLDPLTRKHLRMYRVLERAFLAETLARRGKPNEAMEAIGKAFQELDEIAPQGLAIYPRLRTLHLYPAWIQSKIALGDGTGVKQAEDALRDLAMRAAKAGPAELGKDEYEESYMNTLVNVFVEQRMNADKLLADYYQKRFAENQGQARVAARTGWMDALLDRRVIVQSFPDYFPGARFQLPMGEETLQLARLLKDAGDAKNAAVVQSQAVELLCTPSPDHSADQQARYATGCVAAKGSL